jgi:hypothetical protein
MRHLRLQATTDDVLISDLPIVFTGTTMACIKYATEQGYRWKSKPSMLFGGYYVNDDGNCLQVDTVLRTVANKSS